MAPERRAADGPPVSLDAVADDCLATAVGFLDAPSLAASRATSRALRAAADERATWLVLALGRRLRRLGLELGWKRADERLALAHLRDAHMELLAAETGSARLESLLLVELCARSALAASREVEELVDETLRTRGAVRRFGFRASARALLRETKVDVDFQPQRRA